MADTWWRFYNTAPDHPKILRLTDMQFRAWTTLNSFASKMGGTIPDDMGLIALTLRKQIGKARELVQVLLSAALLDRVEGGYVPHNWDEKQFKGDNSTDRVRKYRERVRQGGGKVGDYLEHRNAVFARDGDACIYCGATETLVVDHVVPVVQGGPGEPWNLATACKGCNSGKAGRNPFQALLSFVSDVHRDFCRAAVTRCNRDRNAPETETNTETERTKKAAPLGRFDEFWLVCPKKTGRGAAEKAWVKAVSLADQQTLIDAMRAYAGSRVGQDKTFTKTPGPWLNGKHWLDEGIAPSGPAMSPEEIEAARDKADRYFKRGKYLETVQYD